MVGRLGSAPRKQGHDAQAARTRRGESQPDRESPRHRSASQDAVKRHADEGGEHHDEEGLERVHAALGAGAAPASARESASSIFASERIVAPIGSGFSSLSFQREKVVG